MIMCDEYEKGEEEAIVIFSGDFLKLAWCVWEIGLILSRDKVLRDVIPNRPLLILKF
jgi:hypothetical protein